MKLRTMLNQTWLPAKVLALAIILSLGCGQLITSAHAAYSPLALTVQSQASQGFAAPGNLLPANFLVVVTDENGAPVTNLIKSDFTIINHFALPGQICGFSNQIVTFNNTGTGAYHIQVRNPGCVWVKGDYLAQVIVSQGARNGQTAVTLSVN